MRVILVPGLFAPTNSLDCLRETIEGAGYDCAQPDFGIITLLKGELDILRQLISNTGSSVVVGHSIGSLLGLLASITNRKNIRGVIGMGTPIAGFICPPVPYYEARSCIDGLLPLFGADEVRKFSTLHSMLPFDREVQNWVVRKLNRIDERVDRENGLWYNGDTERRSCIPFNEGRGEL